MTTANFERFDASGNSYGPISRAIRNVADNLESEQIPVGETDIFGDVITAESNAADAKLTREKMADLLEKLASELRNVR